MSPSSLKSSSVSKIPSLSSSKSTISFIPSPSLSWAEDSLQSLFPPEGSTSGCVCGFWPPFVALFAVEVPETVSKISAKPSPSVSTKFAGSIIPSLSVSKAASIKSETLFSEMSLIPSFSESVSA